MTKRVLVLSDIFGLCAGLERLLADLNHAGADVQLVDPYQGKRQQFANEASAYTEYIAQCGHDAYAAIASQALQSSVQRYDIAIGFSAGASALWRSLAQIDSKQVKQAKLFYPGQIHQYLAVKPQIPTQIIFGNSEPHFDVASVCAQLQGKPDVSAQRTHFKHGFMNLVSNAFNEQGYQQNARLIMRVLCSNAATETAKRQGNQNVKTVDRTLLAYIKKPAAETGYIDLVTTTKNGLSYIYQGERWARQFPAFCMGMCRNSQGEEIEISPLSRHYAVKGEETLMVKDAAKQRYQLWLMKKLKQNRESAE